MNDPSGISATKAPGRKITPCSAIGVCPFELSPGKTPFGRHEPLLRRLLSEVARLTWRELHCFLDVLTRFWRDWKEGRLRPGNIV
jgi:hypothetical protein